ncbi:MAG TPA: DUF1697 domain-containing protein [Thermomicrobiaceae bacterium]|nr:DUF1697 domain-containing protein [Thermomicrobiaceae bacterium]
MPGYVALLRGINVGGKNKVAMADLRAIAESLGYGGVSTYIQSGNLIFTSDDGDTGAMAAALRERIAERLGIRPDVVVLSRDELAEAVASNPFPGAVSPKSLHAIFRDRELDAAEMDAVNQIQQRAREGGSPDEVKVIGRTSYLHTPNGIGRSKLAAMLSSRLKDGTARNWATVTKLLEMLNE